jgi:RNA polymerase sigma-70 factor (ECF subfamily)
MSHYPLADSVPDADLLPRIAQGDAAAFTTLFRRRQTDVYRFALHMTGRPATAEDITQEVFLTVMRDAARYEGGRSSVRAWLCGIARNHALRRLERDRGVVPLDDDAEERARDAALHPDPLGEMSRTERIETVRKAVSSLPVRYREAIILCDLQELSYADAAAALDCAVGTVRSRLFRARAFLASKVRASETPPRGAAAQAPAPIVKPITRYTI